MSERHPIIAITGSSGAGTTSVTRTFENIFRREGVNAAIIEGDSFHRGQHHVAQVGLARVLAGTGRGLQDHRAVGLLRRLHDGQDLFQVVDIESRHAVAVFGGVVQHLAQGNKSHRNLQKIYDK